MEWSTHLLSGAVAGYYVTGGNFKGALVGGVAGIISDLDEPESKFGKVLLPISIPLNQLFGHRTLTHSLVFILGCGLLSYLLTDLWVVYSVMAGIMAHVLGDMLTGKVMFLYPLKKQIGIPIPRMFFIVMDRITRYSLLVVVVLIFMTHLKSI